MPLVAGTVAMSAAAVSVDLGDRTVDLQSDMAPQLLAMCNGRRTVAQLVDAFGDGAREMLSALIDAGALVDGADAWKVLHRQSSAGTALGRPIDEATLASLLRSSSRPVLEDRPGFACEAQSSRVVDLARARRSTDLDEPPRIPTFGQLSTILSALFSFGASDGHGTHGSAGGIYPLMVHVLLRNPIGPVGAGLWWHDPRELRLRPAVAGEDNHDVRDLFIGDPAIARLLEREGPIIFLSADVGRPSRKYGARAYRYALIEAGSALQSAALAATELCIPLRAVGGIDDSPVQRFLALRPQTVCLLAIVLG
jgi:SagB-type dehydrogenase family enzyme